MRAALAAAALAALGIVAFTCTLLAMTPAPEHHLELAADSTERSDEYLWLCPGPDGNGWRLCALSMSVSEEDYYSAGPRWAVRGPAWPIEAPSALIDPDDPYVRTAAAHILSETEGYPDDARKLAALRFVGSAVEYAEDEELFGRNEFWAAPAQTLYLHRGDCEDSSVLLCSILLAMGYDAILLDFPVHIAVGVESGAEADLAWEWSGKRWVLCESTSASRPLGSSEVAEGEPEFRAPSEPGIFEGVLSSARGAIWGLTGLRSVFKE
ncbi:MAG: hypothetical protein IKP53_08140 [Candidatus Methanomethylophilaceae archaeon]|nr:hypothetical protein [Candidatus Methanomethylophilaceae archaeon]